MTTTPDDIADIEKSLLSAAIAEAGILDQYGEQLSAENFTDSRRGCLWGALVDLQSAGVNVSDFTLLVSRLRKMGVLEKIGGQHELLAIGHHGGTGPNAGRYVEEIIETSDRRRIEALARQLADAAADLTTPAAETAERFEAQLASLRSQRGDDVPQTLGDAEGDVLAHIRDVRSGKALPGIESGLGAIDKVTGGLFPSDLIIAAARPSMGKTALAMSISLHVARHEGPVLVASLEMSGKDLAMRILASEVGIPVRNLRAAAIEDHEMRDLEQAAEQGRAIPLNLWVPRTCTVARLRATARVQQAMGGLSLLVVDYLSLVTPADRRVPRHEQMAQITRDLKALARELNVPVLALCQLNRQAEADSNKTAVPKLHHLRESGAIEQDADVVMLLHREDRASTKAILDLAKMRQGPIGVVDLVFEPDRCLFRDPVTVAEWDPTEAYEDVIE